MAAYIETIQKKKKKRQKDLRMMGAMSGAGAYCGAHLATVMNMNPRMGIADALNPMLEHALMRPLEYSVTKEQALAIAGIIGAAWIFYMFRVSAKDAKQHDPAAEAKMMDEASLKAYQIKRCDPIGKEGAKIAGSNNVIFSKDIFLSMDGDRTRRNCNVLVVGGSGTGKSRFFAAPNILQYNSNFVITDPSGELLDAYGKALENAGYEVLVFNVQDPYRSIRYNPFHYIKTEKDVFVLVNTLIKNTTPPDAHKGDPIWENGEKLILEAVILYLWHKAPESRQTFSQVLEFITLAKMEENESSGSNAAKLDLLFDELEEEDPDNLAVRQYKLFKLAAGKTLQSFLISVATRLQSFALPDMAYLTSEDGFRFETFADTKKALFVIIPTADTTFNFIVSMLYSHLFMSLYEYVETRVEFGWKAVIGERNIIRTVQADSKEESRKAKKEMKNFVASCKEGCTKKYNERKKYYEIYNKDNALVGWRGTEEAADRLIEALPKLRVEKCQRHCPIHVRFILDEFANIGQLPDFNEKLSTVRKYWISCAIIIQALSQLKDMYKDSWNTIVANCDTKLFLGCDDQETIKWIVDALGKKQIRVRNESYQVGGGGSESYNTQSVELMPYDKIAGMEDDECIVRIRGVDPYYGKKFEITRHPNYEAAMKLKGQFEIPLDPEIEKKRDKDRTPLRLRQEKARKKLFNKDQANEQLKEKTEKERAEENKKNKDQAEKDARDAKDALDNMSNAPEAPDLNEETAEAILSSMGLSKDATEEQIREAAESLILIDQPSMDVMTYGITA